MSAPVSTARTRCRTPAGFTAAALGPASSRRPLPARSRARERADGYRCGRPQAVRDADRGLCSSVPRHPVLRLLALRARLPYPARKQEPQATETFRTLEPVRQRLVLVSPAVPVQELNVIASAARAGVGHVVKATSKASTDSPIARRRGQAEIEAGLAASGLPHTLLRSNAYMQNTLMLAPVIAKTSSFGSVAGKGRAGMVDTRDVAAVAAEIATAPTPHAGQTYWLSGPEAISNYDAAETLAGVLGQDTNVTPLTLDDHLEAIISAGVPE